jgi:hypothetical protein
MARRANGSTPTRKTYAVLYMINIELNRKQVPIDLNQYILISNVSICSLLLD